MTSVAPSGPPVSFPDDLIPAGAVVDGATLKSPVDDAFAYVVVGSGAAGAVAAHVLAVSGASVAMVEEGPWIHTRDFSERVYDAFRHLFRDAGMQVIEGRSYVPLLQGRCVGGSTVVNSAIAHRTPEDVLDEWARSGLGGAISAKTLEPHFEALERELSTQAVSDAALGDNDRRFLDEASAHGTPGRRTHRYEHGCRGSGRCFTGCPSAAKQGMSVTYVPWALALGRADLHVRVGSSDVVIEGGRATGVVARSASRSSAVRAGNSARHAPGAPRRRDRGQRRANPQSLAPERPPLRGPGRTFSVPPRLRHRRPLRRRGGREDRRDPGSRGSRVSGAPIG